MDQHRSRRKLAAPLSYLPESFTGKPAFPFGGLRKSQPLSRSAKLRRSRCCLSDYGDAPSAGCEPSLLRSTPYAAIVVP